MLDFLKSVLPQAMSRKRALTYEEAARMLQKNPDQLRAMERNYKNYSAITVGDGLFDVSAKQVANTMRQNTTAAAANELTTRIVNELLASTFNGEIDGPAVTAEELIEAYPESVRPQLTGSLMSLDINSDRPSIMEVLESYAQWQKTGKAFWYHHFRQGLDILDLDPYLYEILGRNQNSMGFWLPALQNAVAGYGFFKIPETKVVRVPMPILQLARKDYNMLTSTTLRIVDEWAMRAFNLDVNRTYFVKTGVFSSKYDFRNCKVEGEKEVRELGEYLLFIQHQTVLMAGSLSGHPTYGAATTNEWVVREYIEDVEDNPCIYKGLPLHTEYRVFIDCDTDEVLGVSPYWHPEVMKRRFESGTKEGDEVNQIHMKHDYIVYLTHEPVLMKRYNDNVARVVKEVKALLPDLNLPGQWSLDVMQNGDDFWAIDMALADQSALSECVPCGKLKKSKELWLAP